MEYFGNCRDNDNWLAILGILLGDFSYSFGIVSPTTTEVELGYYHQKVIVLRASWDASRFQTRNRKKLGNFKKIYEILGITNKCPARHFWQSRKTIAKNQLLSVLQKKLFHLISRFCLQYFVKSCGKLRTFATYMTPRSFFQINLEEKGTFKSIFAYLKNYRPEE